MSFFNLPEPDARPVEEQIREGVEAMQREWDRGPYEPSFRIVSPAEYERMAARLRSHGRAE